MIPAAQSDYFVQLRDDDGFEVGSLELFLGEAVRELQGQGDQDDGGFRGDGA